MSRLKRLWHRFERVGRYVLVGGGVTLFYSLLTVCLITQRIAVDPTLASAIASLITLPVSFLVHRAITYADVTPGASQWRRFAVVAGSNFIVATGAMKAVDVSGWPYWVGLVIGWILIPLINYTINAVWVFRTKTFLALDDDHA